MNTETKTPGYKLICETIIKVKIEKRRNLEINFFRKKDDLLCETQHSFVITKTYINGYQLHQQ